MLNKILSLSLLLTLSSAVAAPRKNQPADNIAKCNENCWSKNFAGQDLSRHVGSNRRYDGSSFHNAVLPEDMRLADLIDCDLRGVRAENVSFSGCRFDGAYIDEQTNFKGSIFGSTAGLQNARYPKCNGPLTAQQFDVAGRINDEIAELLSRGLKPCDSRIAGAIQPVLYVAPEPVYHNLNDVMRKCAWEKTINDCAALAAGFKHQRHLRLLDAETKQEQFPLQVAVQANHPAAVKWLATDPKLDLEVTDPKGLTCLHNATDYQLEAVKALLEVGANPNDRFTTSVPPIHSAISKGQPGIVQALVETGKINLDRSISDTGTPLAIARKSYEYYTIFPNGDKSSRANAVVKVLEQAQSIQASMFSKCRWFPGDCK